MLLHTSEAPVGQGGHKTPFDNVIEDITRQCDESVENLVLQLPYVTVVKFHCSRSFRIRNETIGHRQAYIHMPLTTAGFLES